MAHLPNLTVSSSSPTTSPTTTDITPPPARGAEMLSFLQSRLQKNRAPPLVHSWDFWHDRQDRSPANNADNAASPSAYENRLVRLATVDDIRSFWSVFNNFDTTTLPLRDSVHLFKRGVKPIWEDPRNTHGGAWTFRVPRALAPQFWRDVCLMAIGEQLGKAVEEEGVERFRDDICGVSLGVRYGSCLVQVWNRDGEHESGVRRVLETVVQGLEEGCVPREGTYYYKMHREHGAFAGGEGEKVDNKVVASPGGEEGGANEG